MENKSCRNCKHYPPEINAGTTCDDNFPRCHEENKATPVSDDVLARFDEEFNYFLGPKTEHAMQLKSFIARELARKEQEVHEQYRPLVWIAEEILPILNKCAVPENCGEQIKCDFGGGCKYLKLKSALAKLEGMNCPICRHKMYKQERVGFCHNCGFSCSELHLENLNAREQAAERRGAEKAYKTRCEDCERTLDAEKRRAAVETLLGKWMNSNPSASV